MKTNRNNLLLLAAISMACTAPIAFAADYYWDSDDTTPGFGNTTGIWDTAPFWSNDATGASTTALTPITSSDTVNFGTATLNYANSAVGVAAGGVTTNKIVLGAGQLNSLTLGGAASNGLLTLDGTSPTITVNNPANILTIGYNATDTGTHLAGTSGFTKDGLGTLIVARQTGTPDPISGNILVKNGTYSALARIDSVPTVTLGGSGSSGAIFTTSRIINSAIVANAPDSGLLVIGSDAPGSVNQLFGTLTLNGNLTMRTPAGTGAGSSNIKNNVSGTGNLTLEHVNTTGGLSVVDGTVNMTGNIIALGNSTGATTITSNIGSNVGSITKNGSAGMTLAGANAHTGTTTVNAGTLTLNYAGLIPQDNSKLADTAPLVLGGGTVNLAGATGSHTEVVASTTLTANTSSAVTRGGGNTAVLQLGTITRNGGSFLNIGADGVATTNVLNNASGYIGTWATVGGRDWATNSTNLANGPIVAYTGYTDVARLTPGTIADGSTTDVRIVEGSGTAGNITLGATTTAINTLNQSVSGGTSAATIDPANGETLRTNAILVGTGAGALSIEPTDAATSTLTTATAGGDLLVINNSANSFTVRSVIADNTSASTLTKTGTGRLVLRGANTFTGGVSILSGTLESQLVTTTLGTGTVTIQGGASFLTGQNNSNAYTINTPNGVPAVIGANGAGSGFTLSGPVTLNGDLTLQTFNNPISPPTVAAATLTGGVTGTGNLLLNNLGLAANTITINTNAINHSGSITLQGTGTGLTTIGADIGPNVTGIIQNTNSATLILNGFNSYTGNTTVNTGILRVNQAVTVDNANPNNDASTVTIASGAQMNLQYTGTDKVAKLIIAGVQQAVGVYGRVGSGAQFERAQLINGNGTITVGPATPPGFSTWITGTFTNGTVPALQQGPNADPDNDGISNLVEYAIAGEDPTVPKATIGSFNGTLLSFSKRLDASGITYAIQESTDLGIADDWDEVGSYTENTPSTISYTLTPGTPPKNFLRLQVVD
jgi:fibronectin-binding autotransporter adhesin